MAWKVAWRSMGLIRIKCVFGFHDWCYTAFDRNRHCHTCDIEQTWYLLWNEVVEWFDINDNELSTGYFYGCFKKRVGYSLK